MPTSFAGEISDFQRLFSGVFKKRFRGYLLKNKIAKAAHSCRHFAEFERFVLRGAKRIRPFLLFLGANRLQNSGFNADDPLWDVAIGIELAHAGTLVHDDIIDMSPRRRGGQSLHKKIGMPQALVMGDVALSAGIDFLAQSKFPAALKTKAMREFLRAAVLCGEGQLLDIGYAARRRISQNELFRMYELKTAEFGFVMPLVVGAILTNKSRYIPLYGSIGRKFGVLFQLHDDISDIESDGESVLKKVKFDARNLKLKLSKRIDARIENSSLPNSIKFNLIRFNALIREEID